MIRRIFHQNWVWIVAVYGILLFELIIIGLLPYLLGKAVDAVLAEEYRDFWLYLAALIIGLIVGVSRRAFDTRAFMKVWCNAAIETVRKLVDSGMKTTTIINRSDLVYRYVGFFENTIPRTTHCFVDIIISLIMIWIVIPWTGCAVTGLTVITITTSYYLACWEKRVDVRIQASREKINHAIEHKRDANIKTGYHELRKHQVRLSDIDSINWGIVDVAEVTSKVLIIFALAQQGHTVGTIMATITYGLRLFMKIGMLTYSFMEIKEIEVANDLTQGAVQ